MFSSNLIEAVEIEIPAANLQETLLFRLEVLSQGQGTGRRYRCRLYRLEHLRLQVLDNSADRKRKWRAADYRAWVVDDNLGIGDRSYKSGKQAKASALSMLRDQLGLS